MNLQAERIPIQISPPLAGVEFEIRLKSTGELAAVMETDGNDEQPLQHCLMGSILFRKKVAKQMKDI